MINFFFTISFLCIFSFNALSIEREFEGVLLQKSNLDSIIIKKTILGPFFKYQGRYLLSFKSLSNVVNMNPEAGVEIKKAGKYYYSSVFTAIPAFILIGASIKSGNINWPVFIGGTGLLGASIILTIPYNKHSIKAVEIYNN